MHDLLCFYPLAHHVPFFVFVLTLYDVHDILALMSYFLFGECMCAWWRVLIRFPYGFVVSHIL